MHRGIFSAESGLYCRVFTEGLFGFRPEGFRSFSLTPHLPSSWDRMAMTDVHACSGKPYDIEVRRVSDARIKVTVTIQGKRVLSETVADGTTLHCNL